MNCGDALELMQRYIDEELSDETEQSVMGHLENCHECEDVFSRLIRLDEQLRELPKVAPRFSLVDAILPKLDEFSLSDEEKTALTDKDFTVSRDTYDEDSKAVFLGLRGNKDLAETSLNSDKMTPRRASRHVRRWKWSYGVAGAAAASLIFTVFALQWVPGNGAVSYEKTSLLEDSTAPQLPASESNASSSESVIAEQSQVGGQSESLPNQAEAGSANLGATPSTPVSRVDGRSDGNQKSTPSRSQSPNTSRSGSDAATPSGPAKAQVVPTSEAPTASPFDKAASGGGQIGFTQKMPAADEDPTQLDSTEEKQLSGAEQPPTVTGLKPLSTEPPEAESVKGLLSPDGSRIAHVENNRIVIRDAQSKELTFRSKLEWKSGAQVKPLRWLNNNQFLYEAVIEGGSNRYVVDLLSGSEQPAN